MKIEWNKVTWYSKAAAVLVFIATFVIAFNLGILYEQTNIETALVQVPITKTPVTKTPTSPSAEVGGKAGAHCGGFIRNAPTCATGFHCQLKVSNPDTGGICVAN